MKSQPPFLHYEDGNKADGPDNEHTKASDRDQEQFGFLDSKWQVHPGRRYLSFFISLCMLSACLQLGGCSRDMLWWLGWERAAQRKPSFILGKKKKICGRCRCSALLEKKIPSLWNTGFCFIYHSRKCLKDMSFLMSRQWLTPLDPIRNKQ